jgi:ASCH domain
MTRAQLTPEERRERARLRSERWRRAHGIGPRKPAERPWLALGISRSTFLVPAEGQSPPAGRFGASCCRKRGRARTARLADREPARVARQDRGGAFGDGEGVELSANGNLKGLSVRQPFADLIVRGIKPIENRLWQTPYRGLVYIHAAVKPHSMPREEIEFVFGVKLDRPPRVYGAIVGRAVLVDIVQHSESRLFQGPYGWVFEHAEELTPIPMRGAQGLFDFTLPQRA